MRDNDADADDDIVFAEATAETDFDTPLDAGEVTPDESATTIDDSVESASDPDGVDAKANDALDAQSEGALAAFPDLSTLPPPEMPAFQRAASTQSRRSPATLALVTGAAAAGLSLLCLLPLTALRVLPTLAGLAALICGCQALAGHHARTGSRHTLFAAAGLALGLLGIFAGPLWLNAAGDRWRHSQTSRVVTRNLQHIGEALNGFHNAEKRFPAGGSFAESADGFPVGMHGWMTDLLPHLGRPDLAAAIDRRRPWSDPVNAPALSTRVDAFLTPDTPYALTATGHAPAHFAGVGGHAETEFGSADQGLFGRNSSVTRKDVTDGLSQTLAAGEIAQTIPAWGEPDNWRSIGSGLNQSPHGFGNFAGTGAHFLLADGSVRFLSSRTSSRTLQQLSTRNGGEESR